MVVESCRLSESTVVVDGGCSHNWALEVVAIVVIDGGCSHNWVSEVVVIVVVDGGCSHN